MRELDLGCLIVDLLASQEESTSFEKAFWIVHTLAPTTNLNRSGGERVLVNLVPQLGGEVEDRRVLLGLGRRADLAESWWLLSRHLGCARRLIVGDPW